MNHMTVDCAGIPDKAALHLALAGALHFPEYYGKNLDALYDCLMDIRQDTTLTLLNWDMLGSFSAGFRAVLEEAEGENAHLTVHIK